MDVSELAAKIEEFGPVAYLVTTGEGGAPHVVSVLPAWEGEELVVPAGKSSSGNAREQPSVTLLWSGPPGADYCLIVDGAARAVASESGGAGEAGGIAVRPVRAVLHRLAQADADLPSCVTVLDNRPGR